MSTDERDCDETKVTALGRNPAAHHGAVNLPPYRASTMIFPSMGAMAATNGRQYETYRYGRVNSPSIEAFEEAVAQLEGGARGVACPSGMAAIAVALMAYVKVPDLPAIVAAARASRGDDIALVLDNTWATPIFFKALAKGIDVSIHAATKYIVGHSDAVLGVCVCSEKNFKRVKDTAVNFGLCGGCS